MKIIRMIPVAMLVMIASCSSLSGAAAKHPAAFETLKKIAYVEARDKFRELSERYLGDAEKSKLVAQLGKELVTVKRYLEGVLDREAGELALERAADLIIQIKED